MPDIFSDRYPITPPHSSGAASTSLKESGIGNTKSARAVMVSAYPPSRSHPVNTASAQRFSVPLRHWCALTTRAAEPGHTDSITDPPPVDAGADGSHPADDLMTRDDRQVSGDQVTLCQLQVRSTHSACGDLDDDLAGVRARVVVVDGLERVCLDRSRLAKLLCPAHGTGQFTGPGCR